MQSLNSQYHRLLSPLVHGADSVQKHYNDRTGGTMYRHSGPMTLSVDVSGGVPVPTWRRLSPHIPFADTIWQMMGTTDLTWLNKYAAFIWGPYSEDGELPKAYGIRWGWQWDTVLDHLRNDPTSRQVFLSTWFAPEDVTASPRSPMPPCLVGLQLRIINHRLELTVFSRSCDIVIGLPHDVMNMCFVAHLIANELKVATGAVHFMFSDLHLYEGHRDAADEMLSYEWLPERQVRIPRYWTREYVTDPITRADDLVTGTRDYWKIDLAHIPHVRVGISR